VGTLLILLLGWYFVHSRSATSSGASHQQAAAPAPVAQENAPLAEKSPVATEAASNSPVLARDASAAAQRNASGDSSGRWRVIAFTYNREDQAKQKANEIAQSHPDLNPTVFTPNGHAPFLVTLGGPMSKQEAFAYSGKAKREGMPRDVYAQNYRGSGN
jgi:hypothetical protein